MASDLRKLLELVSLDRLRVTCEKRGLSPDGTAAELRTRLARSLRGDVDQLLPLLWRTELIAFLGAQDFEGRGHVAYVSQASRDHLERLARLVLAGDPQATAARPLGDDSPLQFLQSDDGEPAEPAESPLVEKVKRLGIERQRGHIYYVKD